MYIGEMKFYPYLIFYPDMYSKNYDGIHNGGIKGIKDEAPEDIKREYREWRLLEQKSLSSGVLI